MRNTVLFFILAASFVGNVSLCLRSAIAGGSEANSEAYSEAHSEAPQGWWSVSRPSPASQTNRNIQANPHLSPQAKRQVDIINKDGNVTLRGTVPTDADKQRINSMAEQSGAQNISNQIKVQNTGVKKAPTRPKTLIVKPKN